jgi:hypothetical protein
MGDDMRISRTNGLLPALLVCSFMAIAAPAAAEPVIGYVKTIEGQAFVERAAGRETLQAGAPLYQSDVCETAEGGTLGMTFRDNMVLSIGPKTRITLASYEFEPVEKKLGVLIRIARGTLQYISGLVAKLNPDAVSIETPVANIAVRGTRFAVRVEEEN